MTDHIQASLDNRVLTIRFNRADKKNAITQAMYTKIADTLLAARDNPEVRCVLIAGQPECFCSGNDLVDFLNSPAGDENSPVLRFMRALADFNKPVVAAVSGIAVGVGVTLMLHCDLVYCGEQTKLSLPFVSLGICPEFSATYVLPRLMGHQRASELVFCGPFDAKKALDYGLVNALAPNAEVEALARKQAGMLAQMPPNAVRTSRMLMKHWRHDLVMESIPHEAQYFMSMLNMPEAKEAIGAFVEKRKPDFSKFV